MLSCPSLCQHRLSFSLSSPRHFSTSGGCSSHCSTPSTWAATAPQLHVSPNIPPSAASCPLTSVGSPDLLHAVAHEDDAGQLREGLDDIEVAQGAHLEEGHAVLLGVGACLLRWHLPLEGQVQPVPHQDPRDTWGVLQQGKKWRNHGYTQFSYALLSCNSSQGKRSRSCSVAKGLPSSTSVWWG